MARGKKTYEQLEAELKLLKKGQTTSAITVLGTAAFKWGALVWISYYAFRAVEALAGQQTFANIVLDILGHVTVQIGFGWACGAGGVLYGWRQRKLRKDVVERLSGRIADLERQLDSRRSSSRLTPRGDTRPEDRI